jgi:hypothetical protein
MSDYGKPRAGDKEMTVAGCDAPVPTMRAALLVPRDIVAVNRYFLIEIVTATCKGKASREVTYRTARDAAGAAADAPVHNKIFRNDTLVGMVARGDERS